MSDWSELPAPPARSGHVPRPLLAGGALLAVLVVQEPERDADLSELGATAIALSDRFDDLSPGTSLAGILLAMTRSFLSTTSMASRAHRRWGAGGAEWQYSRIWMARLKRAAGGHEQDRNDV